MPEPASDRARGGPGRGPSLASRITLLVIGVATLVAVTTGVATLQLMRAALDEQAHEQLGQQAAVLAEGESLDEAATRARAWARELGDSWAVVSTDGSVRGTAARWVDDAVVAALLSGTPVSDTTRAGRAPVILEARPVAGGGIVLARSESSVAEASRRLVARFLPIVVIAAILAIAGGALLARRITRPLRATARAANALAEGRRDLPVPRSGVPEVDDVAAALAALDAALVSSEGRQREFLLSISHELRTPLTAVRGYAEALSDGMIEPDAVPAVGRTLVAETERIDRFVEDLLELARLEAEDFRLESTAVDLADIAREAADAWGATAAGLGVGIRVVGGGGDDGVEAGRMPRTPVVTDPRRVRQLVDGLIENALRVSPEGAELQLVVASGDHAAAFSVRDEGPGLSDDDLARAFDRGLLRDRYRGSRPVGTGLGLSIAHRLAARLGGRLTASRVPAGGTDFTVHLPVRRPDPPL